jgi:hypothetical protein
VIPVLIVAAAPLPAAAIAPPLDVPMRQVQTEVRDDGRTRRTFRLERTLRFAAEPEGFVVVLTSVSAEAEADADERARYKLANRGLMGRSMRVHLDREGKVRAIDDLPAVWAAWVEGLRAAAVDGPGAATLQRLDALPDDQRIAMLGAMATAVIAAPAERVVAPERPVSLASPPPFERLALTGTTAASAQDGRIVTRTTAAGAAPAGDARISLSITRTVDPVTGLLTASQRRTTTSTPRGTLTVTTGQTIEW